MANEERSPLHSTTNSNTNSVRHPKGDDKIRWFLVIWTAILTLLVFIAYLDTKDIRVLLGGTIAAIAVSFVYSYYFGKESRNP